MGIKIPLNKKPAVINLKADKIFWTQLMADVGKIHIKVSVLGPQERSFKF